MRTIAYKTANCINSRVIDSLPNNWITEYTFTDLQAENALLESDGWNFLPEDEFNILLSSTNTQEKMNKFIDEQKQDAIEKFEAFKAMMKASQNQ